jgi:hypothetical protein
LIGVAELDAGTFEAVEAKRRSSWRRGAAGVVVALCALLSACDAANDGGGTEDDLLEPPGTQSSAPVRPGGLGAVAVTGGEADGFRVVAADEPAVRVERSACTPVAQALSGTVIGEPATTVVRQASGEGAVVSVILAEYADGQAQAAMDALATAVDACAAGFTATVDDAERSFGKITRELAPEGADQAMGLGAALKKDGVRTPVKGVVFRKGNTIAYISAVPAGATPKNFSVPTTVIDAQLAKLS